MLPYNSGYQWQPFHAQQVAGGPRRAASTLQNSFSPPSLPAHLLTMAPKRKNALPGGAAATPEQPSVFPGLAVPAACLPASQPDPSLCFEEGAGPLLLRASPPQALPLLQPP